MLLEKRKMKNKENVIAFRARVEEATGVSYRKIPVTWDAYAVFLGPIFCKRNNVYVVGVDFEVSPEGHEIYRSFIRVIL